MEQTSFERIPKRIDLLFYHNRYNKANHKKLTEVPLFYAEALKHMFIDGISEEECKDILNYYNCIMNKKKWETQLKELDESEKSTLKVSTTLGGNILNKINNIKVQNIQLIGPLEYTTDINKFIIGYKYDNTIIYPVFNRDLNTQPNITAKLYEDIKASAESLFSVLRPYKYGIIYKVYGNI